MNPARRRIRVLIADDSPVMLDVLALVLSDDPEIEVIGRASNGKQAVELACQLRPDVITMDLLMPELDGFAATATIMKDAPTRVIVISGVDEQQLELSFRAVAAGALEVIRKPSPNGTSDVAAWGKRVAEAVRVLSVVPVVRRSSRAASPTGEALVGGGIDVIGIVASTGGPPALAVLLSALPRPLPVPVVVAQHLASGFTEGFARWLGDASQRTVMVAEHGALPITDRVYLPPDGHHIEVGDDERFMLRIGIDRIVPSGDRLLASLASAYRTRACGVVLTGMGDDGASGLLEIRRAGGLTLAQDEASSTVFGMPRAARDRGATDRLLSPELIAAYIRAQCRATTPGRLY